MIKLQWESGKGGKVKVEGTMEDFMVEVQRVTGIRKDQQEFWTGVPRHKVVYRGTDTMANCIKSGDVVIVKEVEKAPTRGPLYREVVPADNSCLFTSIHRLLKDKDIGDLRGIVASIVLSNPSVWTSASLGMDPEEYATWIQKPSSWGGEIELAILSEHLKVEIGAVDIQTRLLLVYGEGRGYEERIYVIYDGIHYDALMADLSKGRHVTRFSPSDDGVKGEVVAIAESLFKQRMFTDGAHYTLRCMVCNAGLTGNDGAVKHGRETGHTNFCEYK